MIDFSKRAIPFTQSELLFVDLYRAGGMDLLLTAYRSLKPTLDCREHDDFLRVYAWVTVQEQAEAAAAETLPSRQDLCTAPKSLPDNDLRLSSPGKS